MEFLEPKHKRGMGNGELTYLKTKFLKFVFLFKACMQVWAVKMGLGKGGHANQNYPNIILF